MGHKVYGRQNVLEFLKRIEELATAYDLSLEILLRMMPELLRDNALLWYRNNNLQWNICHKFRESMQDFFLPSRYFERLKNDIRQRLQRPNENFKDSLLAIQDLMRHADYSEPQKLGRIFRNMRSEYQLY